MLHVHRSERADALGVDAGPARRGATRGPHDTRGGVGPHKRHRAVADAAPVRTPGGGRPAGRTACAPTSTFPFPGSLVSTALARATGNDPKADPWLPERAVWPLMEVVEEHFDEPWLAPLADHIRNAGRHERRSRAGDAGGGRIVVSPSSGTWQTCSTATRCTGPTCCSVGLRDRRSSMRRSGSSSSGGCSAQRIGRPSPAEHLQTACRKLREERDLLDLPRRLSLFGLTRLPASYLDALDAVASKRDVHLFLLHPSPELWRRLEEQVGPGTRHLPRREDVTASAPHNPLLASWGRDAREMQLVLGGAQTHAEEAMAERARVRPPCCSGSRTTSGPTVRRRP